MKIKHYKPEARLTSDQYIIDEDNCITIPYSALFTAGLSSDTEFMVMEKLAADNIYCIVPEGYNYNNKEYEFVQKATRTKEEGLKIDVKGLFDFKPGDSVSLDVFEFQMMLYDRVTVVKKNNEEEEKSKKETGLDTSEEEEFWEEMRKKYSPKGMKNPFEKDPYAPDENTIEMMGDNIHKKFSDLADKCKNLSNIHKKDQINDYTDLIENPPSFEELDQMFGSLLKDILDKSTKRLHKSKDPLLNEFIDDMLARVYGGNGQKVVMISSDELDQFVKDMTWWYNRIKGGK